MQTLLTALAGGDLDHIDRRGLNRATYAWQEEYFEDVAHASELARRRYFAGRVLSGIASELTDELLISLHVREAWSDAGDAVGDDAWGAVRPRALRLLAE